jgi:hypothetical protein
MDLGAIFSDLSLAGIAAEGGSELDEYGKLFDKDRRLKRRSRRKARRAGRKTRRVSRRDLRRSTRGLKGSEKRQARRAGRKAIRTHRRTTRKSLRASRGLKGTAIPTAQKVGAIKAAGTRSAAMKKLRQQRVAAHRAAALKRARAKVLSQRQAAQQARGGRGCRPGSRRVNRAGEKKVCVPIHPGAKRGRWTDATHQARDLPQTSEQAMAFAAEAQYQPEQYATPEQAYTDEQQSYAPETLDSSSYSTYSTGGGGGGGGGGGMDPYEAAAPAEMSAGADDGYEDEEEVGSDEGGPNKLLIGVGALAVVGGLGFYFFKARSGAADTDNFDSGDDDLDAADLP